MSLFLHGVSVPHRKHASDQSAARLEYPQRVTIPMSMHIGAPATPTVKVGDIVSIGTRIGEGKAPVSSHIYASISGKVSKIQDFLLSNGSTVPAVVIESDGEGRVDQDIKAPELNTRESLIDAIRASGVVGLGGAGFPTYVKMNVEPSRIEALIINGAECEPYITSDSYTMVNRHEDMAFAIQKLQEILGIQRIIIGIEANKKNAIASIRKLTMQAPHIEVKILPSIYPQGGEKVLVYHTTGKVIPVGKLPIDVGCIVCNCTTIAAIGHYFKTGMPLVNKCVTVDGGAVNQPQNIIVPIGTSIAEVFDFCGGLHSDPVKVLYGGPMMGITVPDMTAPILKNTNAVLALTAKETKLPKTTACIRCGSCTNACPFGLAPASIAIAFRKKDEARLSALSVNTCMECGCCSFVCPANRPLVQTNKLAKAFLKDCRSKEKNQT